MDSRQDDQRGHKLSTVELLEHYVQTMKTGERMLWLIVRSCLDDGETPESVAKRLEMSKASMYRHLRNQNLTHGRGRLPAHGT